MEELESRFVPVDRLSSADTAGSPPQLDLSTLREYLEIQRDLTELFPRGDWEERDFRKVPSGRMFGSFDYFDQDRALVIGTYKPPFTEHATVLNLLLTEEPGEPLGDRLVDIGFPVPIDEPTVLIGRPDLDEGALLMYTPGPKGLAELVYRIRTEEDRASVIVSAVRPPEPRFSELVQAYRETFDWEGALVFEDRHALDREEGTLHPPGSKVHRTL